MNVPYLQSLTNALSCLRGAHAEALMVLSDARKKDEWALRFSFLSESVRWRELAAAHPDEPMLAVLADLCEALAKVEVALSREAAAVQERSLPPPDLRLGKKRDGLGGHEGGGKIDPRYQT